MYNILLFLVLFPFFTPYLLLLVVHRVSECPWLSVEWSQEYYVLWCWAAVILDTLCSAAGLHGAGLVLVSG